jgi:hypothetical protein
VMVHALGYNVFNLKALFPGASYIILPVFIAVLFWVKLVYLRLVSMMFGIRGYFRNHFFEFVRFSFLSLLIITTLIFVLNIYGVQMVHSMKTILIGFMVIWGIKMFVRLRKDLKFPNIYIISYLCTSEILPLIIFIKQLN